MAEAMYAGETLLMGFPVPPLIRFVGQESALISNANGGPRIFFNIEDHQSYQTGTANAKFDVSGISQPSSHSFKSKYVMRSLYPWVCKAKDFLTSITALSSRIQSKAQWNALQQQPTPPL